MNRDADDHSAPSSDSLSTPRVFEINDAAAADPPRETFAELLYVNEGNRSLKSLAILSLGLTNGLLIIYVILRQQQGGNWWATIWF